MDNQRLRNLTTELLHTQMDDIYLDIEEITGTTGIMTHQLPAANDALKPYLQEKVTDERFWDGAFDQSHTGETFVPVMTEEDKGAFFVRYQSYREGGNVLKSVY